MGTSSKARRFTKLLVDRIGYDQTCLIAGNLHSGAIALRDRNKDTENVFFKAVEGICYNICYNGTETQALLKAIFTQWNEFSGDINYPVIGAEDYRSSPNKWDRDTKGGAARYRLLDFILSFTSSMLTDLRDGPYKTLTAMVSGDTLPR